MKEFDKLYKEFGPLSEGVAEDHDLAEYGRKLTVELDKKKIGKWQIMDEYPDSLAIWNGDYPDHEVYATPFYYGNENIPISLRDVFYQEEVLYNEVPFKPTYDIKKDVKAYLKIMKKELKSIEDYIK
jgi:hypothetical protein